MATFEVICPECSTPASFDGHLPFREECERCSADLHVCVTCRFHDRFAADECRETSADPVARKDRRNLCEYWKPLEQSAGEETPEDAAKAKLAALFGEAPAKQKPAALGDDDDKSSGDSEVDAAKAKLEALFGGKK